MGAEASRKRQTPRKHLQPEGRPPRKPVLMGDFELRPPASWRRRLLTSRRSLVRAQYRPLAGKPCKARACHRSRGLDPGRQSGVLGATRGPSVFRPTSAAPSRVSPSAPRPVLAACAGGPARPPPRSSPRAPELSLLTTSAAGGGRCRPTRRLQRPLTPNDRAATRSWGGGRIRHSPLEANQHTSRKNRNFREP